MKSTRLILKPSLIFFLILSLYTLGNTQSIWIDYIAADDDTSRLTYQQKDAFDLILASRFISTAHIITINPLSFSQDSGEVKIDIPNNPLSPLTFFAKDVNYNNDTSYTWYGELADSYSSHYGWAAVESLNGRIYGTVSFDSLNYSIKDLGGLNVIAPIDTTIWGASCGYSEGNDTSGVGGEEIIETRSGDNCLARVLFLYSNKAEEALGLSGILSAANTVVLNHKAAIFRSKIREDEVKIQSVGLVKIVDYTETTILSDDIDGLFTDFVFHSADGKNILELRDYYEADIVIMFANGRNRSWFIAGLAGNTRLDGEAGGFVLFDVDYLDDPTLSPHELGHIYRAEHEDCDCHDDTHRCFFNSPAVNNVGHVFSVPFSFWPFKRWFKTTMYGEVSKNVILNYSNPDQTYFGVPTGLSNETAPSGEYGRNNAAMVRSQGCTVANFRITNSPFFVNISPLPATSDLDWFTACECSTLSFEATTYGGGAGSVSFSWSTTIDGIHWTHIGYGYSMNVSIPCLIDLPNEYFAIRVIATSPDGQKSTAIRSITLVPVFDDLPNGQTCIDHRSTKINESFLSNEFFEIIPNPSDGDFDLFFNSVQRDLREIIILDFAGNVVRKIKDGNKFAEKQISIRDMTLSPGLYFIVVKSQNNNVISKLVINN